MPTLATSHQAHSHWKDINEVKARHLRWIPFTLVYTEEEINSWGGRMEWLEHQGFRVVDRELIEHAYR